MDKPLPHRPEGPAKRAPSRLRADVLIPKDLPITQIEIEIFAALLEDGDMLFSEVAEAAE